MIRYNAIAEFVRGLYARLISLASALGGPLNVAHIARSPTLCCRLALAAAVTAGEAKRSPAPARRSRTASSPLPSRDGPPSTVRRRRDALAARDGGQEGFAVDDIRTTDPIDDAYLAAHDLFVRSTIRRIAGRRSRKPHSRRRWNRAPWLDRIPPCVAARQVRRLRDVPVLPCVHGEYRLQELHRRLRDRHGARRGRGAPLFTWAACGLQDRERRVVYLRRSPRPDVRVLATVDEDSYEPPAPSGWAITR